MKPSCSHSYPLKFILFHFYWSHISELSSSICWCLLSHSYSLVSFSLSLSRLSLHDNYKWFRPLKATRFGVEKQYIMYNQYVINYCSRHKSSCLLLFLFSFLGDLRSTTECEVREPILHTSSRWVQI